MNIKPHLRYQIENCQIRTYPWYHVLFDRIFTADQYAQILNQLPVEASLDNIRNVRNSIGMSYSPNRFILDDLNKINNENQRKFWQNLYADFTDGELMQAVLRRFNKLIQQRIGPDYADNCEFYDTIELTQDKAGYDLPLHPDAFTKIFSIIINLAQDGDPINQGTAIYAFNGDLIYQSEYKPNTGFGVFRSDDSWHGVEPTTADRWTLQYIVWGKDR